MVMMMAIMMMITMIMIMIMIDDAAATADDDDEAINTIYIYTELPLTCTPNTAQVQSSDTKTVVVSEVLNEQQNILIYKFIVKRIVIPIEETHCSTYVLIFISVY